MVVECLKGPVGTFWTLLTLAVGRGFERWGRQSSASAPPPGWVGEFGGTPLPLATHEPGSPEDLPLKYLGVIHALPPWMSGEEDL